MISPACRSSSSWDCRRCCADLPSRPMRAARSSNVSGRPASRSVVRTRAAAAGDWSRAACAPAECPVFLCDFFVFFVDFISACRLLTPRNTTGRLRASPGPPAFEFPSCPGGGIGRRAGFRYQWSDPWRFESSPGHQAAADSLAQRGRRAVQRIAGDSQERRPRVAAGERLYATSAGTRKSTSVPTPGLLHTSR